MPRKYLGGTALTQTQVNRNSPRSNRYAYTSKNRSLSGHRKERLNALVRD